MLALIVVYKCFALLHLWRWAQCAQAGAWVYTNSFPENMYFFSTDTAAPREVGERCRSLRQSAKAVTILSQAENNALNYELYPYGEAGRSDPPTRWHWIGLHRLRHSRKVYHFTWTALGEGNTNYTNWLRRMPGSQDYANIDFHSGRWHGNRNAGQQHRYICDDLNPCHEYCENGGTCYLQGDTGNLRQTPCECPTGFAGHRCESRGICLSSPCTNGGTCNDLGNDILECTCPRGYSGTWCEQDVDECMAARQGDSACELSNVNGCVNTFGDYYCDCLAGFTGDTCSQAKSSCSEMPCANEGTCQFTFRGIQCQCPPGYGGSNCEYGIYVCHSNPCANGGTCLDSAGGYTCQCTEHYTGDVCEQDVDECSEYNYCQGHDCVNEVGSYSCDCPAGFTGPECDTDIDDCADHVNPCYGRGRCINVNGPSYTCDCIDGYDPATRCAIAFAACTPESAVGAAAVVTDDSTRSTSTNVAILVVIIAQLVLIARMSFALLRQTSHTPSPPKRAAQVFTITSHLILIKAV